MNLVKKLFFIISFFIIEGCNSSVPSSMIIIALEQISSQSLSCDEETSQKSNSGIQMLCEEGARFTHAYTTSVLSLPALTSVLTGLYPYQHNIHDNGANFLKGEFKNLPEDLLLLQNVRTAFFSGGAPIWRKSGIHQGFELFDDYISPNTQKLHRPLDQSIQLLLTWIGQKRHDPFLGVIFAPDLNFVNTPTLNEWGEVRNLTYESQLEHLDQKIFILLSRLKELNLWENTTVVLLGLQGRSEEGRSYEPIPVNLNWEATQVPLIIKPWHKKGLKPGKIKIDQNISLADVGKTLFDLWEIQEKYPKTVSTGSQTSFKNYLENDSSSKNPSNVGPMDRLITIESGWAAWKKLGPIRWALRKGHYLYLHNKRPLLFNTLTDRLESSPLVTQEDSSILDNFKGEINQFYEEPWAGLSQLELRKVNIPYMLWAQNSSNTQLLSELLNLEKKFPDDFELKNWLALAALEAADWQNLIRIGSSLKNSTITEIGSKNISQKWVSAHQDPCLRLLLSRNKDHLNGDGCPDKIFLDLVNWLKSDILGLNKDLVQNKFIRRYRDATIDQKIFKYFLATHQVWDLNLPRPLTPSRTDLALSLPENQKFLDLFLRETSTELEPEYSLEE